MSEAKILATITILTNLSWNLKKEALKSGRKKTEPTPPNFHFLNLQFYHQQFSIQTFAHTTTIS
jgi:hypothetical protein